MSAEKHPSLFAGDKLKCEALWVRWRSVHLHICIYMLMHKRFVLKPFNGAKTETALKKKNWQGKNESLFSLHFEGVWHVHFMPSQRLGNPTSVCSPACPLSTPPSSPAAPRVTELNTLLIYFILFLLLFIRQKRGTSDTCDL